MVVKELFGKVKIYRLHTRVDNRGSLAYVFDESIDDFKAWETRIYSMPKEGTFFGIHYRDESDPMTKFVTVIKGRGLDYDLNAPFISENDEENRMVFIGISKVFSTKDNRQYETIGAFWDELSKEYGRENLRGLGYNWTSETIEYVIGLKSGDIDNANCSVVLPNSGWIAVKGKTAELDMIYQEIYADGVLTYEIETFTDEGECEILYYR